MERQTSNIPCPNVNKPDHKPSCELCHGSNIVTVYINTTEIVDPKDCCPICGGIGMFGIDENNKAKKCYYCQGTGLNKKAVA